jgi:regulator of RNase E activity RraA
MTERTLKNRNLNRTFAAISTALVFDASVRLDVNLRVAPAGIHPLLAASRLAGRVLPVQHYGSVDVFLEAFGTAELGDVLVIDNHGRIDESCVGDLTALEAQGSGLSGMVIWGCHRDTAELLQVRLPVFSYGSCPAGPLQQRPRDATALEWATFGSFNVGRDDVVFADDDGVIFIREVDAEKVLSIARDIWQTERRQAEAVRNGKKLREQLRFDEYLAKRVNDQSYTFRQHIRALGGAIEQ